MEGIAVFGFDGHIALDGAIVVATQMGCRNNCVAIAIHSGKVTHLVAGILIGSGVDGIDLVAIGVDGTAEGMTVQIHIQILGQGQIDRLIGFQSPVFLQRGSCKYIFHHGDHVRCDHVEAFLIGMEAVEGMHTGGYIKFCMERLVVDQIQQMYAPLFTSLSDSGRKFIHIGFFIEGIPVWNIEQNEEQFCIGIGSRHGIEQLFQTTDGGRLVKAGSTYRRHLTYGDVRPVVVSTAIDENEIKIHPLRYFRQFSENAVVV